MCFVTTVLSVPVCCVTIVLRHYCVKMSLCVVSLLCESVPVCCVTTVLRCPCVLCHYCVKVPLCVVSLLC